ncbi:hypothetical protein TPHV1_70053 [Treponema phagedenis]|uniref:Uncharacterized protein n=1 Tax=Treponema phagedenis TaxID=162 RepID=A0A0B7H1T3_TREPH|nr:hypothetical protein TPHV1_70053 [Treponema phagedenis]
MSILYIKLMDIIYKERLQKASNIIILYSNPFKSLTTSDLENIFYQKKYKHCFYHFWHVICF